jgi:hypothetical protein
LLITDSRNPEGLPYKNNEFTSSVVNVSSWTLHQMQAPFFFAGQHAGRA